MFHWHLTPEEQAAVDEAYLRDLTRWDWIAAAVLAWTVGECIVSTKTAMVRFADGTIAVVARRRLRLNSKLPVQSAR